MARDNKGLQTPIPNKTSFVYGKYSTKTPIQTKVKKGGDLRATASNNNGK